MAAPRSDKPTVRLWVACVLLVRSRPAAFSQAM